MMPELVPGRLYLASKLKRPKVGRAVVFTHGQQTFIKKILSITPAGYQVAGTTSFATSSQDLGLISKNKIIGAILWPLHSGSF